MRELGVHDHRLLGGGRWRDSGMAWLSPGVAGRRRRRCIPRRSCARTSTTRPALLADILREVRPQVVVTYDPRAATGTPTT